MKAILQLKFEHWASTQHTAYLHAHIYKFDLHEVVQVLKGSSC